VGLASRVPHHCATYPDRVTARLSGTGSGFGMTEPTRVYVDMVGDLFHAGHVALLRAARELGNHLVVGSCPTRRSPLTSDSRS
jgi:cytidyltransferase-like protein